MTSLEREIAAAVAQAARAMAAARLPVDRDDVAQEGFAIALEAAETWDPAVGPLGPYLKVVLRRALGKAAARWLCPLSLTNEAAKTAEVIECEQLGDVLDEEALTPEQLVAEAEARARVAEAVARALQEMPARAREIAANDFDEPSPVVAARLGITGQRVRIVRSDLARRVRAAVG